MVRRPGVVRLAETGMNLRGELLWCLGSDDEVRAAYRRVLGLATSAPERRFLTRRFEQH